jgi:hypothetical protein
MKYEVNRLRREAAQYLQIAALSDDEQSCKSLLAIAEQRRESAQDLEA